MTWVHSEVLAVWFYTTAGLWLLYVSFCVREVGVWGAPLLGNTQVVGVCPDIKRRNEEREKSGHH